MSLRDDLREAWGNWYGFVIVLPLVLLLEWLIRH